MNGKLGKKFAIYGTILTASLALLIGQAIVRRSAPRRPAAPAPTPQSSPDAIATPAAGEETTALDDSGTDDERVEALESSIETLQSLLPADRSTELEQIGRAWAIERREPEPRTGESEAAPPPAPRIENAGALSSGRGELLDVDALAEYLVDHPLTAIAITPDGRLAAIGGELYAVGDELPGGLGSIAAIHARAISVACNGTERRVALGPLALRPRPAAPAPETAPGTAPGTSSGTGPSAPPVRSTNPTATGASVPAAGATLPATQSTQGSAAAPSQHTDSANAPAAAAPKSKN